MDLSLQWLRRDFRFPLFAGKGSGPVTSGSTPSDLERFLEDLTTMSRRGTRSSGIYIIGRRVSLVTLRRAQDSDLHADPLVLQVTLSRLHPKEKVTAPGSLNIKDFVRSILLVLILLGEAKRGNALDLKV